MKQFYSEITRGIAAGGRLILTLEEWPGRVYTRWQTVMMRPESGAATAEYAVVLIAATGFAGLLMAILRSDTMKEWLTGLVQKALNV